MTAAAGHMRIGVDLGGTKIEGIVLDGANQVVAGPIRVATPRDDYPATLSTIGDVIDRLEQALGPVISSPDPKSRPIPNIGIGIPGSIIRATGRVQNANSTWLNGQPLKADLERNLGRPVRLANDANCFALSEASDGAGAGAHSVFGVILGTGCGGGLVIGGRLLDGPLGIAGEWGHNPLPWPLPDETPGPACWCGRHGCMEAWVSGPALEADYAARSGMPRNGSEIAVAATNRDSVAIETLRRHTDRLGRGLAHVINIFDPDIIVLGGGLSNLDHLYQELPDAISPHLFTDCPTVDIRRPVWGDSGGVRGAAWLWEA